MFSFVQCYCFLLNKVGTGLVIFDHQTLFKYSIQLQYLVPGCFSDDRPECLIITATAYVLKKSDKRFFNIEFFTKNKAFTKKWKSNFHISTNGLQFDSALSTLSNMSCTQTYQKELNHVKIYYAILYCN